MPLRIAICEDSPAEAAYLRGFLPADCESQLFASGESFLAASSSGRFDLVFLDIYMDKLTGIETAKRFREQDKDAAIVFTTTSSDHALEGFSVNALQYLIKPISEASVREVITRVQKSLAEAASEVITVAVDGQRCELPLRDILYAEVNNKICTIHLTTGSVCTSTSMESLAALLPPPDFLRCHQSYVVNLRYVRSIDRDFTMINGGTAYIRRGDVRKCVRAYKEYLIYSAGREM